MLNSFEGDAVVRVVLSNPIPDRLIDALARVREDLTPAERRALRQIALGRSGPEAARYLGISYETHRKQLAKARLRLRARTTAQAVGIAVSLDLI